MLDDTWALINDQPDAIKLYGSNPSKGKEHNSNFRKMLSRKFHEVIQAHHQVVYLLEPSWIRTS